MYTKIGWDWKSCPKLDDLKEALEPLGVFVTEDPRTEGSDYFGFIFSDHVLTEEELKKLEEDED